MQIASEVGGGKKVSGPPTKGSSSISQWENQVHLDASGTIFEGTALKSIPAQEMRSEDKPILA